MRSHVDHTSCDMGWQRLAASLTCEPHLIRSHLIRSRLSDTPPRYKTLCCLRTLSFCSWSIVLFEFFLVQELSYTQTLSLRECLSRLPCHKGVEPFVVLERDSENYRSTCSSFGSTLTSLHLLHQGNGLKDWSILPWLRYRKWYSSFARTSKCWHLFIRHFIFILFRVCVSATPLSRPKSFLSPLPIRLLCIGEFRHSMKIHCTVTHTVESNKSDG